MARGRVPVSLPPASTMLDWPGDLEGLDCEVWGALSDFADSLGFSLVRVDGMHGYLALVAFHLGNNVILIVDDPSVMVDGAAKSWREASYEIPDFLLDLQEYLRVNRS